MPRTPLLSTPDRHQGVCPTFVRLYPNHKHSFSFRGQQIILKLIPNFTHRTFLTERTFLFFTCRGTKGCHTFQGVATQSPLMSLIVINVIRGCPPRSNPLPVRFPEKAICTRLPHPMYATSVFAPKICMRLPYPMYATSVFAQGYVYDFRFFPARYHRNPYPKNGRNCQKYVRDFRFFRKRLSPSGSSASGNTRKTPSVFLGK